MKTTRIIVNSTPGYIIEASPCPSLYGNLKNLICFRRLHSLSGTPVCEKKRSQEDCPLGGYCPEGRRQSFAPDLRNAFASVASRSPCCSSVGQRLRAASSGMMRVESAVESCRQRIHPLPKSELQIMNVGATGKAA
jgi:hypothetical protein